VGACRQAGRAYGRAGGRRASERSAGVQIIRKLSSGRLCVLGLLPLEE
jgi:hypothetical protein